MKDIIKKHKVEFVWHFTDESNLESIRKHGGLFSLAECEKRGIIIPEPGGNCKGHKIDKIKGLDLYVHLAWRNDHPMLYVARKKENRIPNPCWLKIKASVIFNEGVCFCAGVALEKDMAILTAEKASEEIDFDIIFADISHNDTNIWEQRKDARKAEILVPNFIPVDQIINFAELTARK